MLIYIINIYTVLVASMIKRYKKMCLKPLQSNGISQYF